MRCILAAKPALGIGCAPCASLFSALTCAPRASARLLLFLAVSAEPGSADNPGPERLASQVEHWHLGQGILPVAELTSSVPNSVDPRQRHLDGILAANSSEGEQDVPLLSARGESFRQVLHALTRGRAHCGFYPARLTGYPTLGSLEVTYFEPPEEPFDSEGTGWLESEDSSSLIPLRRWDPLSDSALGALGFLA